MQTTRQPRSQAENRFANCELNETETAIETETEAEAEVAVGWQWH